MQIKITETVEGQTFYRECKIDNVNPILLQEAIRELTDIFKTHEKFKQDFFNSKKIIQQ